MSILINLKRNSSQQIREAVMDMFPYAISSAEMISKMDPRGNMSVISDVMVNRKSGVPYFTWGPYSYWGGKRIVGA